MKRRVIVSALISFGDEYLFIKQDKPGGAYPNTLHIPGGGLKDGEKPINGVAREIKEETGLDMVDVTPFDFDDDFVELKGEQTQFIFLRYIAKSKSKDAVAGSDASEILWISKNELLNHPHNPATLRLLKKAGLIE
jgi:8-oxo-dGTP pyrophosphatase MutT (NUDIX family)